MPREEKTGCDFSARFKAVFTRSKSQLPAGTGEQPAPAPGAVPPSGGPAAPGGSALWETAYTQLSADKKTIFSKLAGEDLQSAEVSQKIDGLLDGVKKKQETCDEKRWKVNVGGHEIILRDYAVKLTSGLAMAGDVAVEFAPGPAKLVWPVLKGIMSVSGVRHFMSRQRAEYQRGGGHTKVN